LWPRLVGHTGTEEHAAFIDTIAARDTAHARDIMREHVQCTADRVTHTDWGTFGI
jgi:GntR family transcriptional regulator, transcriptional repressor for pyruvate dehydrogenase complex